MAASLALPLRTVGPPDEDGNPCLAYFPFSTSDLYNWKFQTPSFTEKPQALIDLLDTVLFTHSPTWEDCQLLLQILFTTEERDRIRRECRKLVPGRDGRPTDDEAIINEFFPLTRPEEGWDYYTAEGRERLKVYRQILIGGLRAAARQPTNLSKVSQIKQGKDESPEALLECLMEAYCTYNESRGS